MHTSTCVITSLKKSYEIHLSFFSFELLPKIRRYFGSNSLGKWKMAIFFLDIAFVKRCTGSLFFYLLKIKDLLHQTNKNPFIHCVVKIAVGWTNLTMRRKRKRMTSKGIRRQSKEFKTARLPRIGSGRERKLNEWINPQRQPRSCHPETRPPHRHRRRLGEWG